MDTQKNTFRIGSPSIKRLIVLGITLLFLIPILFIRSLVYDRKQYRDDAVESIMEPFGSTPELQGMVMAVPFIVTTETTDKEGNVSVQRETKYIIATPKSCAFDMEINPYQLSRGIFSVPVFSGTVAVDITFSPLHVQQFDIDARTIQYDKAMVLFGVRTKKNLTSFPRLNVHGRELEESLIETREASPFSDTVYYMLPEQFVRNGCTITGSLTLQGGKSVNIVPMATDNTFSLRSSWTAPSFSGGWLPTERTLTKDGFSASWHIAGLSTIFPHSWIRPDTADTAARAEKVSTAFITPVDNYKKTERSVKYALLFLIVPFLAIFLCELFSSVHIHPVQYCLIGFADILFYVLLLAISEHLSFGMSYFLAAAGVCLSTLFYASAIFHHFKWGIMLAFVQAVTYVLLFGILQSEDYAFLIGSIGMFAVVVLLMVLTRRVDWYSHSLAVPKTAETTANTEADAFSL